MWGISQGEVAAMLQEGGQIPPDVQQLIDRRFLLLRTSICTAAPDLCARLHQCCTYVMQSTLQPILHSVTARMLRKVLVKAKWMHGFQSVWQNKRQVTCHWLKL